MNKFLQNRRLILMLGVVSLTSFATDNLTSLLNESSNIANKPIMTVKPTNLANTNQVATNAGEPLAINPVKVNNPDSAQDTKIEQFKNLAAIDKDANDLNQLNRKLQLEKVEAEIRKLKNSGNLERKENAHLNNDKLQTIVTGVAINAEGKKIAWLQFIDGGTLMVNIGSSVGKYTVLAIDMAGVTLSEEVQNKKHKWPQTIFLKRVYAMNEVSKKHSTSAKNGFYFTPSPVVTSAIGSSDYVPAIVPSHSDQ